LPVSTTGNTNKAVVRSAVAVFRRTRIIFGKPLELTYTGRHGTSEEMQKIADDVLKAAYALGGQEVGGAPLCK
jgi:1-acyl-sn-glycerol-3-phosphate acyltransferase